VVLLIAWLRRNWLRVVVHLGSLAPLVRLAWAFGGGSLFDPVRQITSGTGRAAIALLVLTLACTPIRIVFGWREVLRVRRALALYAFLYTVLHFLTFAWWDYGLQLDLLGPALFRQGFVVYGLLALVLMIPLAITSTKAWRRKLGRRWQWIHWLFYPAAVLAAVHYLRLGKDQTVPARYAAVVGLLLLIRLPWIRRGLDQLRLRIQTWWRKRTGRERSSTPRT